MTPERLSMFALALDGVADAFEGEIEGADTNIEAIIYGLVQLVEQDSRKQTHPMVQSCLDGCAEMLRHAGFAYYASFK